MSQVIPETTADYEQTRIIERPDGFYWQDKQSGEECGPFASLLQAVADMSGNSDPDIEQHDNLREAEGDLGIADWIDPDTGAPAEGSPPHLDDR